MEIVHLKHNEKTLCGFNPNGVKTTLATIEANCWDCLDAYFRDFDFLSETEIHEKEKIIHVKARYIGTTVASLKYFVSGSFMPLIMDVWVRPDFRGRSLSTILMKKIMKIAGPPIQLKADPFSYSDSEPPGLSEADLRGFYAKLGFVGLTTGKMMVWYPVVKDSALFQVKVVCEGNYYIASVAGHSDMRGTGTSYNSAIGSLICDHKRFFGISFVEPDVVELVNEEQEEST